MQGFSALLIVAGGLALYQMTSLVLGPAGGRQLHVSLSVPAATDEVRIESWTPSPNLALGTLATPTLAASAALRPTVAHRASSTPPSHPAPKAPVPSPASQLVAPVPSPAPHPAPTPGPPIVRDPAPQPSPQERDDD